MIYIESIDNRRQDQTYKLLLLTRVCQQKWLRMEFEPVPVTTRGMCTGIEDTATVTRLSRPGSRQSLNAGRDWCDLDSTARLWLVRAWVRIPFAAIFAGNASGWKKACDVLSSIFNYDMEDCCFD